MTHSNYTTDPTRGLWSHFAAVERSGGALVPKEWSGPPGSFCRFRTKVNQTSSGSGRTHSDVERVSAQSLPFDAAQRISLGRSLMDAACLALASGRLDSAP